MSHYIHHVPGRLRVKTPYIKRNERLGRQVKQHLESIAGIFSFHINTLTGSIVIHYDVDINHPEKILDSLHSQGLLQTMPELSEPRAKKGKYNNGVKTGKGMLDKVSHSLASKAVEIILERSAMALVAALL